MIKMAEKLSAGFPQMRIDLYNTNGKIYFDEMTLSHYGGMVPFIPYDFDIRLGQDFKIEQVKKE